MKSADVQGDCGCGGCGTIMIFPGIGSQTRRDNPSPPARPPTIKETTKNNNQEPQKRDTYIFLTSVPSKLNSFHNPNTVFTHNHPPGPPTQFKTNKQNNNNKKKTKQDKDEKCLKKS